MSIIDSLITDRTAEDLAALEELASAVNAGTATPEQWAKFNRASHKGGYDYTDMNRVAGAMAYLYGQLTGYGYAAGGYRVIEPASGRTEWLESDEPTTGQLAQYLANISALRSAVSVLATTPEAPASMGALTWVEANNIEKILVDLDALIILIARSFPRSNAFTFRSGHRPLPSAESDLGRTWAGLEAASITWRSLGEMDQYLIHYGALG